MCVCVTMCFLGDVPSVCVCVCVCVYFGDVLSVCVFWERSECVSVCVYFGDDWSVFMCVCVGI